MTPELVKQWIARKERASIEFKKARQSLPGNLFETVCAFLNRDGGVILLGVADDGSIEGVEPAAASRLTADIVNLSNNPQKLDPPFLLTPSLVEVEGLPVLVLQVPASSQVHRCAGIVYDRGHDGDYRVQEPVRIAEIVNRKHGFKIDALVRRVNLDRYDDRLNIRVNLIDAYDLLMEFLAKHLSDPFFLEGDLRVSLREKIFREVVANLLVHREYTDARPATLIIYRDRVETNNAAVPHGHGPIRPDRFTPYPKNPTLSKFFMQMGRGEELGSGILNVTKYLPFYTKGGIAQFIEGDPFVTIIPLPPEMPGQVTGQVTGQARLESQLESRLESRTAGRILMALGTDAAGKSELARKLGHKTVSGELHKQVRRLVEAEFIEMTIPDKPNSRLQKYRLTAKGAALIRVQKAT